MGKILTAYFSASGVTARLAAKLASAVKADLFEIKPKVPYTREDLNWNNKNSRSSVEMRDRDYRPEIASAVENMADYDVVFIGFPVWWDREPSIIDTFIESYDMGGKTLVPFCTSGGSGLGETEENFKALAPNAKVVQGKRFAVGVTEDELEEWAKTLL